MTKRLTVLESLGGDVDEEDRVVVGRQDANRSPVRVKRRVYKEERILGRSL